MVLQAAITKLKDELEHSHNETESVRLEVRDLQTRHTQELQDTQLRAQAATQQRIDELERRLHEKYEGIVEQRMQQFKQASAEEQRWASLQMCLCCACVFGLCLFVFSSASLFDFV